MADLYQESGLGHRLTMYCVGYEKKGLELIFLLTQHTLLSFNSSILLYSHFENGAFYLNQK